MRLLALLLALSLPLAACTPQGGTAADDDDSEDITPPDDDDSEDITPPDDDDDMTPTDDDDDDDDDDVTSKPGTLTFEPSAVGAGSIVDVFAATENWAVDQQTGICCADDDAVLLSTQGQATADGIDLRFFFGLFAEGEVAWGMENGDGPVESSFQVSPLDAASIVPLAADAPQAIAVAASGDFSAFSLTLAEEGSALMVRAANIGDTDFHPQLMLIGADGNDIEALAGAADPQNAEYGDPLLVTDASAGDYYLHVTDADLAGGLDYTADIELVTVPLGEPVDVPEVEPNDELADWTDLGTLGAGLWTLSGTAETAGHDPDSNNLNADQDVFTFELEGDSLVRFTLDWGAESDDFDAVVYDNATGATLGFDSDDVISVGMASTAKPEVTLLQMDAGQSFALGIGNWEGADGSAWTMEIKVLPAEWPSNPTDPDPEPPPDQ